MGSGRDPSGTEELLQRQRDPHKTKELDLTHQQVTYQLHCPQRHPEPERGSGSASQAALCVKMHLGLITPQPGVFWFLLI